MPAPGRVEANQPRRRHAAEIEQDQREVASRSSGPAVPLPAARRGHGRQVRSKQPPMRPCAPDEIDIFHDRQVGVASELFEQLTPDEQCLIAVRQAEEPDAQPDADLDQPGRE